MKLSDKSFERVPELEDIEEVRAERPPSVGYCMAAIFVKYDGTNCHQWYANTHTGYWSSYGEVFYFTKAQVKKLIKG